MPERCEVGEPRGDGGAHLQAGEVHALHDVCSHAEVPLSEGEVVDGTIECWLHGSSFDAAHRQAHRPARPSNPSPSTRSRSKATTCTSP